MLFFILWYKALLYCIVKARAQHIINRRLFSFVFLFRFWWCFCVYVCVLVSSSILTLHSVRYIILKLSQPLENIFILSDGKYFSFFCRLFISRLPVFVSDEHHLKSRKFHFFSVSFVKFISSAMERWWLWLQRVQVAKNDRRVKSFSFLLLSSLRVNYIHFRCDAFSHLKNCASCMSRNQPWKTVIGKDFISRFLLATNLTLSLNFILAKFPSISLHYIRSCGPF